MSFNWTQLIPGVSPETSHVATLAIASSTAVVLGLTARASLGSGDEAIVPASKFSLKGLFEMLTEFITGLSDTTIGVHARPFVPFFMSVFFLILFNNLVGLIPGMTPATENMNTAFGFGLFIFVFYNFLGLREHGFIGYIKHFMGPLLFLAPIMFVLEMISHTVRPFSLGLRLSNVMSGDHAVLSLFLDLVPALVPIPFYIMGAFFCFIQAFVFTLLSMVYVAFATAHEH